ncbi:hypothetical protein BCV70DRAFT_197669 [Testicularia cyperi]|uniref:Uncharacterized protein n=1 Tax=Testicularia cyperi TaxID=1882483 RepID=A0A317XZY1_9BASI|nr:hypothetical protein BCV70DRAFT_197669 [Testicularia cyperi]
MVDVARFLPLLLAVVSFSLPSWISAQSSNVPLDHRMDEGESTPETAIENQVRNFLQLGWQENLLKPFLSPRRDVDPNFGVYEITARPDAATDPRFSAEVMNTVKLFALARDAKFLLLGELHDLNQRYLVGLMPLPMNKFFQDVFQPERYESHFALIGFLLDRGTPHMTSVLSYVVVDNIERRSLVGFLKQSPYWGDTEHMFSVLAHGLDDPV